MVAVWAEKATDISSEGTDVTAYNKHILVGHDWGSSALAREVGLPNCLPGFGVKFVEIACRNVDIAVCGSRGPSTTVEITPPADLTRAIDRDSFPMAGLNDATVVDN